MFIITGVGLGYIGQGHALGIACIGLSCTYTCRSRLYMQVYIIHAGIDFIQVMDIIYSIYSSMIDR